MSESLPEVDQQEPTVDLRKEDVFSEAALSCLGLYAAAMLDSFGVATLYVDEQGAVRTANPTRVYLDMDLAHAPDHLEPVFVRPIITQGRPQYVARKPDGTLWEVEYREPEPVEAEGLEDIGDSYE